MKQMLYKEWKLAFHPTVAMFWLLSAMLLIPNYPYYVAFFYTTLGLFFVCLTGRENNDQYFTLTLPVKKKDIVKARMLFAVMIELIQLLVAVPFVILRQRMLLSGNLVGMDANVALFAFAFVLLGSYNLVFFTRYYRRPDRVGTAFLAGSVIFGLLIVIFELLTHIIPFIRDRLDTPDPSFLGEKLAALAVGLALYLFLTWLGYRKAAHSFEKLDL